MTDISLPRLLPALVLAVAALAAGCSHQQPLDSSENTTDNFSKLKAAGIRPVAVGEFTADRHGLLDEARFLKDTLVTELQGAGMFDAGSGASIRGKMISSEMGGRSGSVAARFIVILPDGRIVYDRELHTSNTWGRNANVTHERGYLYSKLVGLLFTDPGFRNAVPR
jgi:hypothetical protein